MKNLALLTGTILLLVSCIWMCEVIALEDDPKPPNEELCQ